VGGGGRLQLLDGVKFRGEDNLADLGQEVGGWKGGDLVVGVFEILEGGRR
jgi:hypothetical protein